MKKTIIALAVAAASIGAAQAENTTLYGSVRMSYNYNDTADNVKDGVKDALKLKGTSKVGQNPYSSSRIGVRGSNDLGNGLEAVYKFEWKVNTDGGTLDQRDAYVGLTGDFGTFLIGRTTLPFDDVASYSDIFNGLPAGHVRGANYSDRFDPGRESNVIAYVNPDIAGTGVEFTAGAIMNGEANKRHVDAWQVTAGYGANGITAKVGYTESISAEKDNNQNAVALALGYENDNFAILGNVERYDQDKVDAQPISWTVAGSVNVSEADKIYASYGQHDYDEPGRKDVKAAGIGYQHNFNKRTRTWVEYGYTDSGIPDADKENTVSIGLRTDF